MLCFHKKPDRNSPLVSMPTQTYQGKAVNTKLQKVRNQRRSPTTFNWRSHNKKTVITAPGRTRPTGPFASTANPEVRPSKANHHQRLRATPSQKTVIVNRVQQLRRESGLANRAAPHTIGVVAAMMPARRPVVRLNIDRASS